MKSNYKKLGPYIQEVVEKNTGNRISKLLGVSIQKMFIPSIANIIGTDLSKYKVVRENQFAYGPVTSRNGDKISVALLQESDCIISTSYTVFEITDQNILLPEYLMMWFRRPEFDRYARYMSHGSVREIFGWEEMCNVELPIPPIEKQKEIVAEYNTIVNRIKLNEQLNRKLEETAQAIYKRWFVDFEFPVSKEYAEEIGRPELEGKPYRSSGGEMVWCGELEKEIPKGWGVGNIGNYSTVKSGYAFKSEWWRKQGFPVIKIGSIQGHTIIISECDYIDANAAIYASRFKAYQGDIVIAMSGATIGKIALVPALTNQAYINQRVGIFDLGQKPIKRAPYLFFTLMQEHVQNEIKNIGGDSAQENISNSQIERIQLLTPGLIIIDYFNTICQGPLKHLLQKMAETVMLENMRNLLLSKLIAQ